MGLGFHSKEARALLRDGRHWEQQSYPNDPQVGPTAADQAEAVEDWAFRAFGGDTPMFRRFMALYESQGRMDPPSEDAQEAA
jgi:hypothetical protein